METIKKLKIKGLCIKTIKISSYRYCELVGENNGIVIRRYTSKPIKRVGDFIKLFNEYLNHLNWELDEYGDDHIKAILAMEKRIYTDEFGILNVRG